MLHFLYDSLEAVKKVTIPTREEFITLTIATLAMIVIFGILLIGADTLFSGLYKLIYSATQG